jgi:uncharacterized protein (TIGR01777 family)
MRVLITGASGLIGSALCDALLARGDEVAALSRDPERARGTNPTVTWHAWDPLRERPPAAAFAGVDAVVNLIGESINQRWTDDAKQRIYASRVDATRSLLQGLAGADPRPRTLISQSAVGYYGDRGEAIVDESTDPGSTFDARLCVDWEAAAAEADSLGMRLAITRMAPVLSADGGLLKELLVPFKLGVGGPLAGGGQYMPLIEIDDAVGMLLWAIDNENVTGALNATLPQPVTNREFSKALGAALHRPAVMPVPKFVIAARLGSELAGSALGSQRVVPRRALDLGYRFRHPEVGGALAAALI